MEYIEDLLGVSVKYKTWEYEAQLPDELKDSYEVKLAHIDGVRALFLYPRTELAQMATVKKHILLIQRLEHLQVVLILPTIHRNRREYMLGARIPFVVPGKQLYLPFLGAHLQEKYEAEMVDFDRLQPSTQVLFFYYLYLKQERLYAGEAGKVLDFSAMTTTRAVRQLEQTGLFRTEKSGLQKVLIGTCPGPELFEKMQPYLTSPVRRRTYIDRQDALPEGFVAGLSALSEKGELPPPEVPCYAVGGKHAPEGGTTKLLDSDRQLEIEIWRYNPGLLGSGGQIDPLSLFVSLRENEDEQVDEAKEQLLDQVWGDPSA